MALVRMEPAHGAGSQPLLQAVDQPGERLGRGAASSRPSRVLALGQRLGDQHVHGRRLEAEVRLQASPQAIEAQADQLGDVLRVPARRGEPDVQRLHLPVHLEQQEAQDARADGIAREVLGQLPQQPRCRLQHVLLAQDRLEELRLRAIGGRRNDGDERLGLAPQRLVEAAQHLGLEAGGERRARLSMISPMRLKPSRRMSASVAADSLSAASGRAAQRGRFLARRHDRCPRASGPWRAIAQDAPAVSAMAVRG